MDDSVWRRMLTGQSSRQPGLGSSRNIRWFIGISVTLAVMLIVSACGTPQAETQPAVSPNATSAPPTTPPQSINLPGWVINGSEKVQAAYTVATVHAAELAYIPCYCSCGQFGHESVVDCFISGTDSTGAPIYDDHAYY